MIGKIEWKEILEWKEGKEEIEEKEEIEAKDHKGLKEQKEVKNFKGWKGFNEVKGDKGMIDKKIKELGTEEIKGDIKEMEGMEEDSAIEETKDIKDVIVMKTEI